MSTPEEIQRDIEGTRRALSTDVDRLTEKVSPGRVVSRRVDRVKSGAASMRDRVMGSMPDPHAARDKAGSGMASARGAVGSAASSVGDTVGSAASTVGDTMAETPQVVRRQTQGNPMGAGLAAFGLGMVIASLLPATEQEKELASSAEQKAMPTVKEKAQEVASGLQDSAKEAAQQVKQVASEGASDTAEQARSAADDVKAPLQG